MSEPHGPASRAGRVVVVTTSYPAHRDDPSGHFVEAEVRALARDGHAVTVLAPDAGDARRARLEQREGVEVRWQPAGDAFGWPGALPRLRARPLRALGALRFVHAARRALRAIPNVERVVAHFIVPCAWPIAALGSRAPLEVVVHGSDLGLVEALPARVRAVLAKHLGACAVRCVSEELRERLGRAFGPDFAARASVKPSPLELVDTPERCAARALLGVAEDARLVVVVGRLLPSKRCETALRAARLLPGVHAVVVGDGPEQQRLAREFPEVRFTGALPRRDALTWIAAADVLLSASEREGAPAVVREARALGTRVVALPAADLELWSRSDPGLSVLVGTPG